LFPAPIGEPKSNGLTARTLLATNITDSAATLNGVFSLQGNFQYVYISFRYHTEDSLGHWKFFETPQIKVSPSVTDKFYTSYKLSGLSPGTTYIYYPVASNDLGTTLGWPEVAFATNPPQEKYFEGGIKFYTDTTGKHGLIASTNDQSLGNKWDDYGTEHIPTGTSIGTGQANTTAICSKFPNKGTAAELCDTLVLNGYSDWFLPSKDELDLLYKQSEYVGGFNTVNTYWSSSESSISNAWAQCFLDGSQNSYQKICTYSVRAIRAY
jgi:hypothetical protein